VNKIMFTKNCYDYGEALSRQLVQPSQSASQKMVFSIVIVIMAGGEAEASAVTKRINLREGRLSLRKLT